MQVLGLAEVSEASDVTGIIEAPTAVRHPDLDTGDLYRGAHVGQALERIVIPSAEEVPEEEVAQGVIARGGELEALGLLAPTAGGATALSALLAQEKVGLETPHLELGVQAEESAPTTDEAIARAHRDAPHLNELDDVVLLTLEG